LVSYARVTHETEELYDAELAQTARILEALLLVELKHSGEPLDELSPSSLHIHIPTLDADDDAEEVRGHKYEKKLAFRAWSLKGVPLLSSDGGSELLSFSHQQGYSVTEVNNKAWRTFTLFSNTLSIWITVAQSVEIRDELTEEIALQNSVILIGLIPLVILLIAWIVPRGLAPLVQINREIQSRDDRNLKPLSHEGIPLELQDVVNSLNKFMASLGESIESQRRFTANAAHELRTPLAGIKIHAQNLKADTERNQRIKNNIISGIDRLSYLFNQLITLNRVEAQARDDELEFVSLSQLLDTTVTNLQAKAEQKQQQLLVKAQTGLSLKANPAKFDILLGNLLGNAIKYTPNGGLISLEVCVIHADKASLIIEDNGPGLSEEEREKAFQRFYRAADQAIEGCGIGLSIVKEICDSAHWHISLSASESGGLRVEVQGIPCHSMAV
jgi:two-component system sensor histidine kinase QseC